MSKVTVAFWSFVAGVSSTLLFLMLSGSQASILAQGGGVVISGVEPTFPPLQGNVFTDAHISGRTQQLDGFECLGCEFKDVAFTYAGGATRIENPKFSGAMRITFKGAAANTLAMVAFLQAMGQNQQPPAFNPNAPIIKKTTAKEVFTADLVTPYGQAK